jgi:hypothetical protein
VYRIQNKSCAPITVQGLGLVRTTAGAVCPAGGVSTEKLDLSATTVPVGATAVIRTGAAAGSAGSICCTPNAQGAAGRCPSGTCTIVETYTVATSAGTATAANTFMVTDATGTTCPSCSNQKLNDWPFRATGSPAATSEGMWTPIGAP